MMRAHTDTSQPGSPSLNLEIDPEVRNIITTLPASFEMEDDLGLPPLPPLFSTNEILEEVPASESISLPEPTTAYARHPALQHFLSKQDYQERVKTITDRTQLAEGIFYAVTLPVQREDALPQLKITKAERKSVKEMYMLRISNKELREEIIKKYNYQISANQGTPAYKEQGPIYIRRHGDVICVVGPLKLLADFFGMYQFSTDYLLHTNDIRHALFEHKEDTKHAHSKRMSVTSSIVPQAVTGGITTNYPSKRSAQKNTSDPLERALFPQKRTLADEGIEPSSKRAKSGFAAVYFYDQPEYELLTKGLTNSLKFIDGIIYAVSNEKQKAAVLSQCHQIKPDHQQPVYLLHIEDERNFNKVYRSYYMTVRGSEKKPGIKDKVTVAHIGTIMVIIGNIRALAEAVDRPDFSTSYLLTTDHIRHEIFEDKTHASKKEKSNPTAPTHVATLLSRKEITAPPLLTASQAEQLFPPMQPATSMHLTGKAPRQMSAAELMQQVQLYQQTGSLPSAPLTTAIPSTTPLTALIGAIEGVAKDTSGKTLFIAVFNTPEEREAVRSYMSGRVATSHMGESANNSLLIYTQTLVDMAAENGLTATLVEQLRKNSLPQLAASIEASSKVSYRSPSGQQE